MLQLETDPGLRTLRTLAATVGFRYLPLFIPAMPSLSLSSNPGSVALGCEGAWHIRGIAPYCNALSRRSPHTEHFQWHHVHAFLSSKSAPADSAGVTRGDTLQNMGNLKYSISCLEKKISGNGIA